MLNPFSLFLSFRGRIGRLAYWFGLIVLIAASPFSFWAVFSDNPFEEVLSLTRQTGFAGLIWSIGLLVPLAALNTKRLHDLGQTGLLGVIFYAPAALTAASFFTGWKPQFEQALWLTDWLGWFTGAAGIWFLIRLGFYGGTNGPNKYGPDPG
ncbi:MAG: DUF805 domain-containing protein [Filomicrobium sp.]